MNLQWQGKNSWHRQIFRSPRLWKPCELMRSFMSKRRCMLQRWAAVQLTLMGSRLSLKRHEPSEDMGYLRSRERAVPYPRHWADGFSFALGWLWSRSAFAAWSSGFWGCTKQARSWPWLQGFKDMTSRWLLISPPTGIWPRRWVSALAGRKRKNKNNKQTKINGGKKREKMKKKRKSQQDLIMQVCEVLDSMLF